MEKIKNSRSFTFKAYEICVDEKYLNDIDEYKKLVAETKFANFSKHIGKFVFASACEYYVEKNILDNFKANLSTQQNTKFYLIYKISTIEDSNVDDLLLMSIYYDNNEKILILD